MKQGNKQIEAVVESWPNKDEAPWPTVDISGYMALHQTLQDKEVGAFMQLGCEYNQIEFSSDAPSTMQSLLALDSFILPGGLRFSEDGQVKIVPGCCCGLEDWHQWMQVTPENCFIWLGHDPEPWVEYVEGKIRVWPNTKNVDGSEIALNYNELTHLLKQVEHDLQGFLARLGQWTEAIAPGLEDKLVPFFAKHLHIPT